MIWMLIMMKWFSLYDLDILRYIFGLRWNILGYFKGNILYSCIICNSLMLWDFILLFKCNEI